MRWLMSLEKEKQIILTAGKRDGKAVVRLDRRHAPEVQGAKIHHVTHGPYKGLLINKKAHNLENGDPSEARLEFLAYLINKDQNNAPVQDAWNLRLHKAMVLMKSYLLLKRVELEVEQVNKVATPEESPKIKSFVSLFTPDIYQYNFVPEISMSNKTFLTFMVKAKCDVHVALSATYGELHKRTIEVLIGGEGNTKSMIKDGVEGSVRAEALTANVLSGTDLRYFWMSWGNHCIEVGRGAHYGEGRFLVWDLPDNKKFDITSLAVATDNTSHGQFEFAELLEARRERVRRQIMCAARKQRILHFLEDVYPNTLSVQEIIQLTCNRGTGDPGTLVQLMKELERTRHVREVEVGRWMRLQHEVQNGTTHEMKMVREMPQLTSREQPTVALVTSLYCEKLAMDAMIEDKVTFVKYKTEAGESQVYTVGTIGRFKVVSTKLARYPTSNQAARISAENAITRLLGIFSKIEHVFLVGVAGGVPNLEEPSQHVRPGDVVVSMTSERNDPMYMHCASIHKESRGRLYSYKTRAFSCQNKILQNVALSLDSIVRSEWMKPRPWELYIDEALEQLNGQEIHFKRPSSDKELRKLRLGGNVITFEHPMATSKHDMRVNAPNVRHGVIGSGKLISRAHELRADFAKRFGVRAFDLDFEAVLESLEGNRNESFLVVRGVCDYVDGKRKDWQSYAALAAAAYTKALLMAL
ncbi:CPMD8-like protein [Mya arenaria]|uniref:CPMD8-like protein n=1 Tax=Mya arenaria TaxID=6604 RepID=A0ABY7DCU6_MYAAR|nr:CPMD8-like protein [Mya arenaria]